MTLEIVFDKDLDCHIRKDKLTFSVIRKLLKHTKKLQPFGRNLKNSELAANEDSPQHGRHSGSNKFGQLISGREKTANSQLGNHTRLFL